jgi:hypothetical protein
MQNAHRTCTVHVGVGDGGTNTFRGVEMAKDAFEVFNWTSINYTNHPAIKDVVYWDKHQQPSHFDCLPELIEAAYGTITAEYLALNVSGIGETGDYHSVSFDYEAQIAFFANSRKTNVSTGNLNAYARQYTWLNISALFNEQL